MPVAWAPPSVRPAPLPAGFPEIYHRDADLPVRFTGPDLKFVRSSWRGSRFCLGGQSWSPLERRQPSRMSPP